MNLPITNEGLPFRPVAQNRQIHFDKLAGERRYACKLCGYVTPWVNNGKELRQEALRHLAQCVPPRLKATR